jgi:hypothetical protein
MQVATVKKSTSFRTKKRGNVPPRLDTLSHPPISQKQSKTKNTNEDRQLT